MGRLAGRMGGAAGLVALSGEPMLPWLCGGGSGRDAGALALSDRAITSTLHFHRPRVSPTTTWNPRSARRRCSRARRLPCARPAINPLCGAPTTDTPSLPLDFIGATPSGPRPAAASPSPPRAGASIISPRSGQPALQPKLGALRPSRAFRRCCESFAARYRLAVADGRASPVDPFFDVDLPTTSKPPRRRWAPQRRQPSGLVERDLALALGFAVMRPCADTDIDAPSRPRYLWLSSSCRSGYAMENVGAPSVRALDDQRPAIADALA